MKTQRRNVKGDHSNPSPSQFHRSKLRVILLFMFCTMLLVLTCTPSILEELSGNPQPPIVELLALSVSELNVSRANLAAKWNVILTIQNPNLVSSFHFDHVEGVVLYEDEEVAVSPLEPFVLGSKEERMVRLRLWRKGWDGDEPVVKEWVVTKIKKDKEGEEMDFSVHMAVWAKIKLGWWWTQRVIMNPHCKDLSFELVPQRGFGMLLDDVPIECSVPMLAN